MKTSELCEEMQNSIYAITAIKDFMVGKAPNEAVYCDNLYFLLDLVIEKQTHLLKQIQTKVQHLL
jgi:hypothetical protein